MPLSMVAASPARHRFGFCRYSGHSEIISDLGQVRCIQVRDMKGRRNLEGLMHWARNVSVSRED